MEMLYSWEDLENLVLEYGFLPFFTNEVDGFSIEDHTPARLWFSATEDGPWEWKGPVAINGKCVYGKFFDKKAGFVSLEWFADFANYRRDGYDFDARVDEGLVPYKDQDIYNLLLKRHAADTKEIKAALGYGKNGLKGFETVITRLQMQTYVNVQNFVYETTKEGEVYGWGIARYTTPEEQYGKTKVRKAYRRKPEQSFKRIIDHLEEKFPNASRESLEALLR